MLHGRYNGDMELAPKSKGCMPPSSSSEGELKLGVSVIAGWMGYDNEQDNFHIVDRTPAKGFPESRLNMVSLCTIVPNTTNIT